MYWALGVRFGMFCSGGHIAGKVDTAADWASRLHAPGSIASELPECLRGLKPSRVALRGQSFYLLPTPVTATALWGTQGNEVRTSEVWASIVDR